MYVSGSTSGNYMTGMSSGMDVDQMVKDLMDAERIPYDNYDQEIQYLEWQMEAYQSSAAEIKSFQDENFDFLNPENNMLSSSTYMTYDVTTSSNSVSAIVSDSSKADESYTMEVTQLATQATMTSDSTVSKSIEASGTVDYSQLDGDRFTMTLDGNEKDVLIEDLDGVAGISLDDLQLSIDKTFGAGKIEVKETGGQLSFDTVDGSGAHVLELSAENPTKTYLGFQDDDYLSNRINPKKTLTEVSTAMNTPFNFDADGMVTLTINGETFEFDGETSLESMMETINSNDNANVTMTYDPLTDKFELIADDTGAGATLVVDETGGDFLSAVGLTSVVAGVDAEATINGEKIVRSSNTFEVDGVIFTANEVTDAPVTINVTLNTDAMFDTILDFVNDYNEMVESIQSDLDEERNYDYDPITGPQKEEMSDDEIENWEEEAKKGILGGDDLLESMLDEMRIALYTPVEGSSLTLADIGITTDTYDNGGKLIVDEEKLQSAIKNDPEAVVNLFTKPSETHPGTGSVRTLSSDELDVRYQEEGLMYRLYDITEKYVSTTSDNNGHKGLLIEKAGFSDDYTEVNSTLYLQLQDMEDRLAEMEEELMEKEENYYAEFSYMETYIYDMNSQMEMIASWTSS